MNFNDYQTKAITTAVYPKHQALPYLALGLSGEAAEVANKVKKILRGDYDNDPTKAEEALVSIVKNLVILFGISLFLPQSLTLTFLLLLLLIWIN